MKAMNRLCWFLLLAGWLLNIPSVKANETGYVTESSQLGVEKEKGEQGEGVKSVQTMRKKVIVRKADEAKQISNDTEREQLIKAREASAATQAREKKILKKQKSGEWQQSQREKAQAEFNTRDDRESKYLNDAKAAAKRDRKIPKSK